MERTADVVRAEIEAAKDSLRSNASSVGDYKLMKIMEARLTGADDPYDLEEYVAERQSVRDTINTLTEEYEALVAAEKSSATTEA